MVKMNKIQSKPLLNRIRKRRIGCLKIVLPMTKETMVSTIHIADGLKAQGKVGERS